MNQYSQQPVQQFQGGLQNSWNQNQTQQFRPTGFVQSNYQGQLSQPTFGRTNQSIVSNPASSNWGAQNPQIGYQQNSAAAYSSFNQPANTNTFISHQPVQSHASSPATAFGNVGPVIARYGYQAGQDSQNQGQFGQQSFYQPVQSSFGSMNAGIGYQNQAAQSFGASQVQSGVTSQHPVYEATHAYQQAGPVIAQLGYQSGQSNSNFR